MSKQSANPAFAICLCLACAAILLFLIRNTISHGPESTKVEIVNNTDSKLAFWVDTDEPNWVGPRQTAVPSEEFIVKAYFQIRVVDEMRKDLGIARIVKEAGKVRIIFP